MFTRNQTITGERLIWHWNTDIHELSYFALLHDLSVFDPANIPSVKFFFNPARYRIDNESLVKIILEHPEVLLGKSFWIPEIEKLANKISFKFKREPAASLHYSRSKITKQPPTTYPKDPDKKIIEKKDPELTLKLVVEAHNEEIETSPNVFSLLGKAWFVKFNRNEWGIYPEHEKYKYIALLLDLFSYKNDPDNIDFSISNLELVGKVKGEKYEVKIFKDEEHGEDLYDETKFDENLTDEEIESLKQVGYNLLAQMTKAKQWDNYNLINELNENLDKYKAHLQKNYGIIPKIRKGNIKRRVHKSCRQVCKINRCYTNFRWKGRIL